MSTKSYYLYIKQFSHDGQTWINVQPLTYSYDGDGTMTPVVKEEHDAACGAMPPIYQWVDTEDTVCVYDGHDYSRDYLTIESLEDNNVIYWKTSNSANTKTISASTDNGATWTAYTSTTNGTQIALLDTGEKVLLKGLNSNYINKNYASTKQFNTYGNIMSLVYGDNFSSQTTLTSGGAFNGLFSGCTGLISAENLVLPATTLVDACYRQMFEGCTSLTVAPELPATTLASRCYESMFEGCTSLTTAPQLPATTLANSCYFLMFQSCASLTTAPELPATTLTERCYDRMFGDCTSLTVAPELPATSLTIWCYQSMFYGCTSLTTAPELPATILAEQCYGWMFSNCTSLTEAPELPATTLVFQCYENMFEFCRSLNYIKCLATDISATDCTKYWLDNVAATGTFVKASSMSDWTTGYNGIPNNWTIQNA